MDLRASQRLPSLVQMARGSPGRVSDILERLLDQATLGSERTVAWLRLLVGVLAIGQLLVTVTSQGKLPSLHPLIDGTMMATGVAFSLVVLRLTARGVAARPLAAASVALDTVLAVAFPLVDSLLPAADYHGFFAGPSFILPGLIAACAGLRLSRNVAVGCVAGTATGMAAIVAAEATLRPDLRPTLSVAVMGFAYFAALSLLGVNMARRARRLVYAAADAAVEAERVRQRLGAYVSEEIATEALKTGRLTLGGQRQPVAVLFTDLRGFTRWAEHVEPERLVAELNGYLDAMVGAVRPEGGVVDKYIGDSVMVVFGIPEPRPDDAVRALRAIAAMQRALVQHNRARAERHLPPLAHGIGAHYGLAVAGNIGTSDRLQYTVVGDTVNLASRLESATKESDVAVLLSSDLIDAARKAGGAMPPVREHGRIHVRGREGEITVFTLDSGQR